MTIKLNDKDFLEIAQWCKDDGLTLQDAQDFVHFIEEKDNDLLYIKDMVGLYTWWKTNKKETL